MLAGPRALDLGSSEMLAIVAVLLSAASYAAAAVYSRVLLRAADPIGLSAVKFVIASVLLVPVVAFHEGVSSNARLDLEGWLSLLFIGCIATGVARCGYVWVISAAGSISASLLTYIVPSATLFLGWIFLGETITWTRTLGAALVGGSLTSILFGRQLTSGTFWKRVIFNHSAAPEEAPNNLTR